MKRNPLYLVLDNIRSALNVGAIFRTCDAALIRKLYLVGITPYPPHDKIPKTALGATKIVPWEYHKDIKSIIQELKKKNINIISVEITERSQNYTEIKYKKPTALVFGHEINGINEKALQLSDNIVQIPMLGKAHSLNVATCAGIITFEILRQWKE